MVLTEQGLKNHLSCFKQLENWKKIYKTTALRHWTISSSSQDSDPWETGNQWSEPWKCLSSWSRQSPGFTGGENPQWGWGWEDVVWNSQRPRCLEFVSGKYKWRGSCRRSRSWRRRRGPFESQAGDLAHACEETTKAREKTYLKGLRRAITAGYTRAKQFVFPPALA